MLSYKLTLSVVVFIPLVQEIGPPEEGDFQAGGAEDTQWGRLLGSSAGMSTAAGQAALGQD